MIHINYVHIPETEDPSVDYRITEIGTSTDGYRMVFDFGNKEISSPNRNSFIDLSDYIHMVLEDFDWYQRWSDEYIGQKEVVSVLKRIKNINLIAYRRDFNDYSRGDSISICNFYETLKNSLEYV